ncbi:MAG: FUSC family protein, partial [Pedobacter sp.]
LKNIEVNIENIVGRVKTINSYFNKNEKKNLKKRDIDVDKFVTKQNMDTKLFFDNLTFSSSTFRHSLRVAIVMLIGFVVAKSLDFAHSYWILLTILVISKPGFSLTKERNFQRLIGTVVGAFIGMGILVYIHDKNTLFVILLVCMIGSYSFQRKNYVVSVLFMTPYILVLFDFLGMGSLSIARERIYDTLIGSGIALLASYSLFPNWEHEKLKEAMIDTLKANMKYFEEVTLLYVEENHNTTNYKVARKQVYVSTSNLASLFQRMFSEPKSKQHHIKELHQFTVLNHLLSSYIATLSLYKKEHAFVYLNFEELKPVSTNTIYLLEQSANNLSVQNDDISNVPLIRRKNLNDLSLDNENMIIAEQFDSIQKVAYDIFKLTEKLKI